MLQQLEIGVEAVSYTHLDVYKRQELGVVLVDGATAGAVALVMTDEHGSLIASG